MNDDRNNIIGKIDWVTVLIYLALVLIGWFSIFSAKYDEMHPSIFDMTQVYGKQLIWIGVALFLGFIVLLLDAKVFSGFSIIIYVLVMFSLVAVLVYGKATKGATSWIDLGGGIKFQPSEFAKLGTALALSSVLSRLDADLRKRKTRLMVYLVIFVPMALVLLQNDTGSAIVFVSFILVSLATLSFFFSCFNPITFFLGSLFVTLCNLFLTSFFTLFFFGSLFAFSLHLLANFSLLSIS